MKKKAVIFDKDGTLLDFEAFWLTISYKAVADILNTLNCEYIPQEEILQALGVKNGIADINGVLCKGTYGQIGKKIYDILVNHGCDCTEEQVRKLTIEAYHNNSGSGIVKPACENITEVFQKLKKLGIKTAVVTADDSFTTRKCLKALGIDTYFEAVYTDDGEYPAKPDPWCIYDFCRKEHLLQSEVVMVGDTLTDVLFAENGDIEMIGVANSEENRNILNGEADVVIPDISHIFEVLE